MCIRDRDTNVFCKEYCINLEDSVNAILVKTKTGELKYAACALLATTRLDINKLIRKKLGARKVSFAEIEETEINYPLQIKCYELIEDSDGAGRFRGGLGLRRDYLFPDTAVSFTVLADRDRWGPDGLFGGLAGRKASYLLKSQGKTTDLGSKTTVQLQPGDIISFRTCGGGGHGSPVERDPQLVLRDVQEGKISAERARTKYKVAIETQNWFVQQDETHKLRMEPTGS